MRQELSMQKREHRIGEVAILYPTMSKVLLRRNVVKGEELNTVVLRLCSLQT